MPLPLLGTAAGVVAGAAAAAEEAQRTADEVAAQAAAEAAAADVARLQAAIEAQPQVEITVDVAGQRVSWDGGQIAATMPDGARGQFVDGTWDALGQLLEAGNAIATTAEGLPYTSNFA